MNFTPLGKRVLIKRVDEETKTAGGIILPDNAKEKPLSGKVEAVSSEITDINKGDEVVFGKYTGTEITLSGTEYLVLELKDILGVLNTSCCGSKTSCDS
ncbi:MAG: Heat shock protein 60 family co-chaperone GroES [uncultured Campylobacterales bacterium]|uniref:Co-chaperonin GroES n=1 Tax=uncultured Campylobacterales bacterium TaxID=352960 RepID=A0A6S6SK15_9BACT|nr:MAG: Heat shock protein 60 family co-chaperone GroES [uncultured Campylobacterales bacterium]